MADLFRRAHARIPCDRSVEIFTGVSGGRRLGEGRLLDASLSGAYLRYASELRPGTTYRLVVDGADGPLELPFRVAREGPGGGSQAPGSRHFGLHFNLSASQERQLVLLLDLLRRQLNHLRDYWSI